MVIDVEKIMSQSELMALEDICFFRDLCSPHEIEKVIKLMLPPLVCGEEIKFEYVTNNIMADNC